VTTYFDSGASPLEQYIAEGCREAVQAHRREDTSRQAVGAKRFI
jgi:hypothetical protein